MSRNHRSHRKAKPSKFQRDPRFRLPSKTAIWNRACDRADEFIEQNLWKEARDVLEAAEREHPGANCILVRLVDVYEELGEVELLASVKNRCSVYPQINGLIRRLIDLDGDFEDDVQRELHDAENGWHLLQFEIYDEPVRSTHSPQVQDWAEEGFEALQERNGQKAEVLFKKCLEAGEEAPDLLNNLAAAYALQGRDTETK